MKRALLTAGWMTLLVAQATGCIRIDDLPQGAAAPDVHTPGRRPERWAQIFSGCRDGEVPRHRASACLSLAGYFEEGSFGFPRDAGRAAQLRESAVDILQASCALGEVTDCTRAALAIEMGIHPGGEPGATTAESTGWMVSYAEDGCRGGDAVGCALLGRIYERGPDGAPDLARSTFYFDQACGLGHRQSCLFLAARAEGALTVPAYERACRAGSGFGCATAAQHHRRGVTVEPSVQRAGALFARGCSLGDPASCVLGAEMYANDSPPDRRRAMQLGWAGCQQGIAGACVVLGDVLEREERHGPAREAYRRACELGEPSACRALRTPRRSEPDVEQNMGDLGEIGD